MRYPSTSRDEGERYTMPVNSDADESGLVLRLREGDEAAFACLVDSYHGAMIHVARGFVRDRETAEEVVQDAWVAVLKGLASFEGRSSIKSWIFAIVINRAKTRGSREARSTPFSALVAQEVSGTQRSVAPDRFLGSDAQWPGHWAQPPQSWGEDPEARLLQTETMAQFARILDELPRAQRTVIVLRDVAGQDAASVCNVLGITETNMRVLLHRARSKVRGALERYFSDVPESARG